MNWCQPARVTIPGIILAVGLVVMSTGCTPGAVPNGSDATSFVELAEDHLSGLAGVEKVALAQFPRDPNADPDGLDRLDAALWGVEMTVTMNETATAEESLSAAGAEIAFSEKWAVDGMWTARIEAGRETTRPEDDISPRRAMSVEVFPVTDLPLTDLVEGALRISQAPGVDFMNSSRGRLSVMSLDATSLALAYDSVSTEALFAAGGSYATTDGRVQLNVFPDQVSPAVIRAIIGQALNYPTADFALVAPLDGPSAPSLFLNRLTSADAGAILSALTDPALAASLVPPFSIPIVIRSDVGDVSGFIGGVDLASP